MLATSATLIMHQRSTSEWTTASIRGTWPPSSWRRQNSSLISRGTSSILVRVVSFSLFSLCLYVASSKYPTGKKYTTQELNVMFWVNNANRQGFKFPADRMLKIGEALTRELLAKPDCLNENGDPMYVVGKDGYTSGLTLGRYSGLEGYICNECGLESKELVIYNFDKKSTNFSEHGDSGLLIWTGHGRMVAMLHSGMLRGMSSHVTFGAPMWWIIRQLLLRYPKAIFNRVTF